jgi:hypothetical protein
MARRVFLSFVAEDLQLVNAFRGQAKSEKSDLEFFDHSVREPFDSKNAEYIRRQIREKINGVSVTVCLIGDTTASSKWVDWEIRTSKALGKGLVGVRLHSCAEDVPPRALKDAGAEIIDWDIKMIMAATERAAKAAGY